MAGLFVTLSRAGWHPGAATAGSPLNHAYDQATTVAWLGIVACQVGTAFAVRTDRASLRSVGVLSNRFLLGGFACSLAFAALLIYTPALQGFFGTAALTPSSPRSRSSSGALTGSAASSHATPGPEDRNNSRHSACNSRTLPPAQAAQVRLMTHAAAEG